VQKHHELPRGTLRTRGEARTVERSGQNASVSLSA